MSHAPGPWQIDQEWLDPKWPDWRAVKIGNTYSSASGHIGEANARLIAAAPDLLAELKDLVRRLEDAGENSYVLKAQAVIAKAEGRS